MKCNMARVLVRQARSILVPWLARLASRCCSGQSPLAVLGGGVKTWRGVKTRSLEELKWHYGRKLRDLSSPDDTTWRGCTASVDPVNAQRRVTFFGMKTQESRREVWKSSSGTLEESCVIRVHRMIRCGEDVPRRSI